MPHKPGAPQLVPYHFKKGQSGNPGGKPSYERTIKSVSPEWAAELKHYMFNENEKEFLVWLEDSGRSMAEKITSKLIHRVYMTGDPNALKILFETLIGKPKETIEIKAVTKRDEMETLTDDDLAKRRAVLATANSTNETQTESTKEETGDGN